jgi:histidine ammonia-lyase
MRADDAVTVDGATLSCAAVAAVARRGAPVAVAPSGLARAVASHEAAVLSRGAEEHAAFSPQAARAAAAMVPRLRTMLACELVAAVRGLRQRAVTPSGARLRAVYDQCRERLPPDDEDHPLDRDIAAAEQVIADLADEREDGSAQTPHERVP